MQNQSRNNDQTACTSLINGYDVCRWMDDPMSPNGGFCDVHCFNPQADTTACAAFGNSSGLCEYRSGTCTPSRLSGISCFDLNQSTCNAEQFCMWSPKGCVDSFTGDMYSDLQQSEPYMFGVNPSPASGQINGLLGSGVLEGKKIYMFGTQINDLTGSSYCNSTSTFIANHSYHLYIDTNGLRSGNCNLTLDNGTLIDGFEYQFKQTLLNITQTKVAYKCVSGVWSPQPLSFQTNKLEMCDMNLAMFGLDKTGLKKSIALWNSSQPLRVAFTIVNATDNLTNVTDSMPTSNLASLYYSPGSVNKVLEDCSAPGQDLDGDGYNSESDPDCIELNRAGYKDIEA